MKKENNKLLFIFLFLLTSWFVFSQENKKIYVDYPFAGLVFEKDNRISIYTIDPFNDVSTEMHGTYVMTTRNYVPFIDVTWENKIKETFLILLNDVVCYIYKPGNINPYMSSFSGSGMRGEHIYKTPKNINATSYLIENGKKYTPDHINDKLDQAWVEGIEGQGINEKIFINLPSGKPYYVTSIYISIGFVSFKYPHLYQENSRPSKIRVTAPGIFSFDVNLLDTPNFQKINFPKDLGENNILEIEILDVYPGTKYEDTCINFILYDTAPMK